MNVEKFLSKQHKLLIDGQWVEPKKPDTHPSINPATGEVISEFAKASAEDVDHAVEAANRALSNPVWATMLPNARSKLLWRIADLIEENADELAEIEMLDQGKPRSFARRGDVAGAAETFRYFAGWCGKLYGKTADLSKPGNFHAYTVKEPVGVVGLIIPWNFPLLMAAWKLAPALASGCTSILKPAEETSLSALRLGELLAQAGVPAGVVNIVTGLGTIVGAALAAHPQVNKISFTGSTAVGKNLLYAASGNLKKLSLELGGKSPNIIFADADLDKAIAGAAMGIFMNAGQVCAAGSRLYVQDSVFDEVMERLTALAKATKVGPGSLADTQMGPLVSEQHRNKVSSYVQKGIQDGAKLITGGSAIGNQGYFFEPTILTDTSSDMSVVRDEIFGPVLVAQSFEDFNEMVKLANDSIYGLSATVWTSDLTTAHLAAKAIQAGTVKINTGGGPDNNMPFGGYKQSGWGREFSNEGLELYLQTKSVIIEL